MKFYPIFVRLDGRPCVVIGGGEVAERKVEGLLAAGARVMLVSPELTPGLSSMVERGAVEHRQRAYRHGDLAGAFLAYAATDDTAVHAEIAAEAARGGVLLNAVDKPDFCNFIVPALVERGDLVLAISTSGSSPMLARRLRERLEGEFGPEYAAALDILGRLRQRLAEAGLASGDRQRLFAALLDSPLLDLLRQGDGDGVQRLLAETLGAEYTGKILG